ncbi:SDR family oxidoreductase [Pseudomonas putida]|jgi:NAD(P)-dependent dehydrogenase (short-subunit alcohol dehydrogenase family)|uniref:Short chain dehydrogenase n=1 Tax=Pseudomonas putida TaxID=303 RepID=A0A379KHX2_PSEPU|nr:MULTISPECIES: SDR family oxidoreductase [Pseudomonas]KAF1307336.1 short-chain dehydrogenase [Pseudomonas sp. SG-MS2]MBG6124636.1 NAD(P)-dependent dehydrogenase (short-subunit alcohol dehydrogenase family) [Pseudomonas sp. M2]NSX22003.1 SDR family oxidoreductase [Pseudomonas putida]SUD67450.1 short chain dehydrogenase [Pseudomonas putida]HDS1745166.1 SDR family oxidoreductase [Pseudomonas putida]
MPTVLITGCSSGIGRALAEAFRDAGHDVWATARKAEDVEHLAGAGFTARQLDVNDAEGLKHLAEELEARHGRLDILVNNAGYGAMGPLLDGGVDALRQQFETNVFAVIGVTGALFPLLRRARGLVVNIGSVSGVLVTPFAGAYCASKAAVHALSDALRLELAPFGIQVMEVQPGAIASQFASNAQRQADQVVAAQSPWWPLREHIQARARASQDRPTSAAQFAQGLLAATRKSPVPAVVRLGNGSTALPLLARWLPRRLLDWVLRKRFGLLRPL